MKFAITKDQPDTARDRYVHSIVDEFLCHGHEISSERNGINFLLNVTTPETLKAGRRRSQSVFVISLVVADRRPEDLRAFCYSALIKTLSNLMICIFPGNGADGPLTDSTEVYFTTPEAGFYRLPFNPEEIYEHILPIAGAHYAIQNEFSPDLPPSFWRPTSVVKSIAHFGKELDSLGVLPTPFPLSKLLSEDDLHHLYKIYGITGLSYGNLSAREHIPELGETTFWMTGRGINKADISRVGKDVLLVKGFNYDRGVALVSMPTEYDQTARVSVDAVEHELIYRTFPRVGAIVHVHAWMRGVKCTKQNYPCGTKELAEEVVGLLDETENPARTVVGLKNHGLTITGPTLDEIFDRIRGQLLREVPMFE